MSYDSDENGSASEDWEVVDIVHTTTSVKPDKKLKTAKKEDVDKLASEIQAQLSLKTTQDTQQILLLEQKMKQQQKMSEQQLVDIQSRLAQITRVQQEQETQQRSLDQQRKNLEQRQKQQLLEQKVAIQSLSEHQMQTQKQIEEAKEQIKSTATKQQMTDNHHNNSGYPLYQTPLTQPSLGTFGISTYSPAEPIYSPAAPTYSTTTNNNNNSNGSALSSNLREIEENLKKLKHNNNNNNNSSHCNIRHSKHNHPNGGGLTHAHANANVNGTGTHNNNSWIPSFFAFGGTGHPSEHNNNNNNNSNASLSSHHVMQPAPPLQSHQPYNMASPPFSMDASAANHLGNTGGLPPAADLDVAAGFGDVSPPSSRPSFANTFQNAFARLRPFAAEEKSNVLVDASHEDDDDVLRWSTDYGPAASGPVPVPDPLAQSQTQQQQPQQSQNKNNNILYQKPHLLKTKSVIGEGKFTPNEKRQCGWIITNKSKVSVKAQATLECVGGDEEERGIKITADSVYDLSLQPNEDAYILIEVQAPSIAGKYCAFYQLAIDGGLCKVGEMLEVTCLVEAQFSTEKESKIATIIKMGFDRKKVITTLQGNKWNVQRSVNTLLGL
eukprot:CAMPEP_0202696928 /NCGR_PEP_ID=MMETSP1385-20130828/10246_1 /ASSEMBLY_ACC=CAM_ASM_000861 /TAXON_ID=933848 /ORGANISM="Elphidium margaritaceum" /LENGTH=607 /DNA_ID=CAMNT_0049353241 /DNA_START=103 /DNA_END=1929 /DNA_ORIENTATION=-